MTVSPERYPPPKHGRVVVWGPLARFPFGGVTWQVIHHVVGLRRLGFDVWYVEDSDAYLYSPPDYSRTADFRTNLDYLVQQLTEFGFADRWIFRAPGTEDCFGGSRGQLLELYRSADAVFNLCGAQEVRADHYSIRSLVYLQTDPVLDQLAVLNGDRKAIEELDAYDLLFTYGENLGAADSPVPLERYTWHPTRPPVCLDFWQTNGSLPERRVLTTVANWKHSSKDVVWRGETWRWSKHVTFERFLDLPTRAELPLELAVGRISPEERHALRRHGWRVASSIVDPQEYRRYIRASLAEFTVAKEQVVRARSGWFSDRSACYLAAGRPVITQDTGIAGVLPTGEGLLTFTTHEEATEAIAAVGADYRRHSEAARAIAHEYFDDRRVLGDVLARVGLR